MAALRPLARTGDPALTGAVAPLLPGRAEAVDPGEGAQIRLFEGLLSLLDALSRERPLLLVVEDLHLADRSTRAALAFLAAGLTGERVLLGASYRPGELDRGHPLRPLLAELERDPRTRRLTLAPLTREQLAEQVADILGEPPHGDLLERLWTRSGGNPLFGEELLAAGGAAPDTPARGADAARRAPVRARAGGPAARRSRRAARPSERLDHPLLEDAGGLEERALRDALRKAVDRRILVADDGAYRFRHALLREIVADDLLPGERAELHLRLARALERRLGESAQDAAAVAHHYDAAGDRPATLAAAIRAATAAERAYAHDEAAALLDRALALWDRVPEAEALAEADRVTVSPAPPRSPARAATRGGSSSCSRPRWPRSDPRAIRGERPPSSRRPPAPSATSTARRPVSRRSSARSSWSWTTRPCSPAWRAR